LIYVDENRIEKAGKKVLSRIDITGVAKQTYWEEKTLRWSKMREFVDKN